MDIPFWEKYTLSIDEAAAYFRIGTMLVTEHWSFTLNTKVRFRHF